jgi:Na+-transporting methylmalonyl-CoA/oxaloacetate decarboxylase gamma subunit
MSKQKNRRVVFLFLFLLLGPGAVWSAGALAQELSKPAAASAQTRELVPGRRSHVSTAATKKPAESKPWPSPTPVAPAVALVSNGQPEYLSGEANVTVKGNQNPIIRLGLAQNGVNIIEFPASDSFFMIHPGNSDLVSFDEDTARLSKRSLVLRPGAAFVAPPPGSASRVPSASISVQMQSGVVVTFLIYPVRELSQNAHRCVVMYNRDEVVASRRAAGLAVNLDGREPEAIMRDTGTLRFGDYGGSDGQPDRNAQPVLGVKKRSVVIADVNSDRADERVRSGKVSKKRPKISEVANRALKDAVKSPSKAGEFSKSNHGLSLATAPAVDLDAQTRLLVIRVRNDSPAVLGIVPGNPEIYVQTFDDQGKTLQIEPVKRLHVETTSLDGRIAAGETVYFAVVYEAPILGAQQRLRVSVSQTNAADEPATTTLAGEAKRN